MLQTERRPARSRAWSVLPNARSFVVARLNAIMSNPRRRKGETMRRMKDQLSRRGLLQVAGAGALTMWIPKPVTGYSHDEMRAKAADGSAIGVSKWELDTPALCVDVTAMERNIATLKQRLAPTGVASRPHAKTHKCPEIAKIQLASGSIGVCTAKVSEAEALFAGGVEPIMMTTCNVTANKIRRAMALRK